MIAFRRDFANRVVRAGPEHSYDALVQFGNAPITNIVNLQWKREALEMYNAGRSQQSTVTHDTLLGEYVAKRKAHSVHRRQHTKSKGVTKWKRPVCMQRKSNLNMALQPSTSN